jgi:hypothetical protein
MPTALPAAATATGSTATQGDVKNWLTSLHDFLADLLGTSGAVSDALTALGLSSVVKTINSTGPDVAGNFVIPSVTSTSITTALGYTPATKPQAAAGVGQWAALSLDPNGGVTLPPGGTWAYSFLGLTYGNGVGISAGGANWANVGGAYTSTTVGFAWRIA